MAAPSPRRVTIEGYSADEVLALSNDELSKFVFCDEALVFRIGSAEILGKFKRTADTLILELAHIDGGGDGALPTLGALAARYASREGLSYIEWRVHAVNCARPNLKLRHLLEKRGFEVRNVEGIGDCYFLRSKARAT
jgi:hypothetical protein